MHQILTHGFLCDNFKKKYKQFLNLYIKIVIKKDMCQIRCIFKTKWFIYFSSKKRFSGSESVKKTLHNDQTMLTNNPRSYDLKIQ